MNSAAGAAFFLLSCFTSCLFTFTPSLCRRHSFVQLLCSRAPRSYLLKRKKSISYSISPTLILRARKRIKPEALRLTKKKLSFFSSRPPQRQRYGNRYVSSRARLAERPAHSPSPLSPYLRRYFSTSGIKLVYPGP